MEIPGYSSWYYQYRRDDTATDVEEWQVVRYFVDICSRMTAKLLQADPKLEHSASVAFADVLSFFLAIPFNRECIDQDVMDYEGDVGTRLTSPVADLKDIVNDLVAAGRSNKNTPDFDVIFPVDATVTRSRSVPVWSPLQCYLQVMMDTKFVAPDLSDWDAMKAVLRTLLQDSESLKPVWYGTGMPSCLFLYQVPKDALQKDLQDIDKPGRILVFTSDCQWGCLRGLHEWARDARLDDLTGRYKSRVDASTNAIRNLYNGKLINYGGRALMVTISDEEKRKILNERFNSSGKDAFDPAKNNKIISQGAKPIFEAAKKDFLATTTNEDTRWTWTPPKGYKTGKAQAFWLPFRADQNVRSRCPRCRVVFNFSMVDESDEVIDWLETVYPGTPCSCAEVLAMWRVGGLPTQIDAPAPTETTKLVTGKKSMARTSLGPFKRVVPVKS